MCNSLINLKPRGRVDNLSNDLPRIRLYQIGSLRSGQLQIVASSAGDSDEPVKLAIRGRRYDATADTFFALFTESTALTEDPRQVFEAGREALGKTGVLELEATAGDATIYRTRLAWETLSEVEIENMRVIREGDRRRLRVRTVQPFIAGGGGGRRARVRLVDAAGEVAAEAMAEVTAEKMDVLLDLEGVPEGEYSAHLALLDASGEVVSEAKRPRPMRVFGDPTPWAGNTLGVSDDVPPPWTPLECEAEGGAVSVECWNRTYRFTSESLLPAEIVSGDSSYLDGPLGVDLVIDGERVTSGPANHELIIRGPKRCLIRSSSETPAGIVSAETSVEFDGFIWIDLSLSPRGQTTVERLALRWRMPPEHSTLLHSGYRSLQHVGATPEYFSKRLNQAQGPFWVGDSAGGISFAVESFQHWSNADTDRQAQVTRGEAGTEVAINVIDRAKPLTDETTWGFCLHPTPVRPRPEDYRKLRPQSWFGKQRHGVDYPVNFSPWNATNRFQGAPVWCVTDEELDWYYEVVRDRERHEAFSYDGMRESGCRSTWYAAYRCTSRNTPGFIWAGQDWRTGERDRLYSGRLRGYYQDMVAVCKTRDFQDWFLWRLDRERKKYPAIDGIYLDLMGWEPCARADHGHGYVDPEGERQPTWAIREHREWMMRLYTYLKHDDPDTPILLHLSGQAPKIMGYSFCDYLWTGELWITEVQRDRSYSGMSLDTFRAELLPQIWGPGKLWISQLGRALGFLPAEERKKGLREWAHRHMLGMLLTHDSVPDSGWILGREETWRILDRYDVSAPDRLLGYWQSDTGISLAPENEELVATAYANADRAFVVIFNNTDRDVDATLTIDGETVFGEAGPLQFEDAETEEALEAGDHLTLPVGMRNFRLVVGSRR